MDYNNNYNYNGYEPQPPVYGQSVALDRQVSAAMKRVYLKMTLALIVTALVSLWCAATPAFMHYYATHSWVMWAIIIAEFALVFGINGAITKLSSPALTGLFYLFAVVNGLMLAPIFLVYTGTSLAKTFFITAGTFAAMSIYGFTTSKDLTKFGSILTMCLFGLIIAVLVNMFTHSSTLDWIISIAGVLIFIGLTAWDTQTIKKMALALPANQYGRLATMGALSLYLDFINLFLFLLRFFGNGRD